MTTKYKSKLLVWFSLITVCGLLLCIITSCGKSGNASPTGLNTQLQIVNLSVDIHPLYLYQDLIRQNNNTYAYPNSSGYFFLSTLTPPLQLRTANNTPLTLLKIDTALRPNSKYTFFITGLRADSSIANSILTLDTVTLPSLGKGKVRFVHASATSVPLDLRANDTLAFSNRVFNTVSPYIELTAGNYTFDISTHKTTNKIETSLKNVTIQDGRAYTIYTKGMVGGTDSLTFGADILTNNLLVPVQQ